MIRRWLYRAFLWLLPVPKEPELPIDRIAFAIGRGEQAKRLLSDETLSAAFEEIEGKLTDQWRGTAAPSSEQREVIFAQIAALQSVRGQLKAWCEDATFLAAKLEKQRR